MANRQIKNVIGISIILVIAFVAAGAWWLRNRAGSAAEPLAQLRSTDLWTRGMGDDWSKFLGPTGDGKSSERGILTDWSNGNLKVLWKMDIGEGYGMGSVAKGRFYHFGRIDGDSVLRCLHAETGEPIWEYSYVSSYRDLYGYDNGPRASPVIDDGRVYLYGVEGMIHCLDAVTGQLIWKLDTQERFGVIQNFFGVASTPIVVDDLLVVMVGGSPIESQLVAPGALDQVKPNESGLIAVDKKTGKLIYQVIDDLASYVSLKKVELNGQPVVLAWMREALFGIRPATGEIQFEFPWRSRKLESVNASVPVVVEDQVLISECYGVGSALLQMGAGSPEILWSDRGKRDKALEAHWNTPITIGDSVYGCSGRHSAPAELRCVDWMTGHVNWSEPGLTRTTLTYIDGHFIVLGEQGRLMLIKSDSKKFDLVTEYEPDEAGVKFQSPCWAAPIVSHGLLFVRGKRQLVCFELIR